MHKRIKVFLAVLLILAMGISLVGCGSSNADKGDNQAPAKITTQLRVGGSTSSTWIYGFSSAWAEMMKQYVPGLDLIVQETAGSTAHYPMFERNEIEIGSGTNYGDSDAYNGVVAGSKPNKTFYSLFPVTKSQMHVFVLDKSSITKVEDLNGKKVAVGAKGSPSSLKTEKVAEILGIKPQWVYSTTTEMMEMVADKRVDAGIYNVGAPYAALLELSSSNKIRMISFTEEQIKKITTSNPTYIRAEITPKHYGFVAQPVINPGATQTLCISTKVPNDVVYNLTKASWEHWSDLVKVMPGAGEVKIEDVLTGVGAPLHPGAIKYYEEKGLNIPANLKP